MSAPKTENPALASFSKVYTSCSLLKHTVSRSLLKPLCPTAVLGTRGRRLD